MKEHNLLEDDEPLSISKDEKLMATLSHLGVFIGTLMPGMGNVLVPFLIWVFKKDQSTYIEEQAKEALNFQITMSILMIGAAIAMIILVGFVVLPILIVLDIALSITAAVKANRGEKYEYPINFRLIK